ncbi:clathrin interactor EPSIN 1-like [Pyrus ussuriensis x Pyrus communis]|uniref:Clathrin interactor EPSIN 1-like n=1 Tax=Pyrus ussuriensis x Pyrus communis TaxID=2448454 RepID=A0A5N5H0G2_9ROSA|nr:clathrin interactor EPSIN 1-like [Pyrus ussuriensis x Pyrus communis]
MDFMKVFDQTVREIKREVNLKVLKVPEMEQKVLDATDNEPWGPHGSALAEIAQATKKFSECQMVMNVLWTRLSETGKDWRHVYKALAVIEYLVSHGSERAVDDIIEHTFQISSLSSFEYVEPSGKDNGINVRKKAETIVALLNNKDKIQEVRNKAAANRDKYFGLSSTGITYKSGSATSSSYGNSSYQSSDRYGGLGGTGAGDSFRDSYKGRHEEDNTEKFSSGRSRRGVTSENRESSSKKGSTRSRKGQDDISSTVSKSSNKSNEADAYNSIHSQSESIPDDDDDDFDPRGTSSTKAAVGSSDQVDLFGQNLMDDFIDAPASVPEEKPGVNSSSTDVDLFADADFVSAPPQAATGVFADSTFVSAPPKAATGNCVDLFASQPIISPPATSTVDLFATPDPVIQPETKSTNAAPTNTNIVDPFATVPLNNFDGSDIMGALASHSDSAASEPSQSSVNDGSHNNLGKQSLADSKTPPKKDFQVKSGVWADSLSRGLIDLNISAPKKVNLADVGIVGGLTDGTDEREKGPPTSYYMGRAMGSGTGLGKSGFPSSQGIGDDLFSSLSGGNQQYQYGGFQK